MSAKFKKTFQCLKTWLWKKKFSAVFNRSDRENLNIEGLRLIIGPGRSGTSWLSKVLAKTSSPITFLNEPLHPFRIKLTYGGKGDHTAVKYSKSLTLQSPLIKLYSLLLSHRDNWIQHLPADIVIRSDNKAKYTLIKEVHSLLATEALLNYFNCRTILITRNPVYVVDSLLSIEGLRTALWRAESKHVIDPEFMEGFNFSNKNKIIETLEKFQDSPDNRKGVIISKTVTIAMTNKMLKILAQRYANAVHITYEDLCSDPVERFKTLASFLNLERGSDFDNLLNDSFKKKSFSEDPYSIFRNTNEQLTRPLKFLKEEEVKLAIDTLTTCDLL
jgi:hypothetical protein